MGFSKLRTWDNRKERRKNGQLQFENGRSWTRRITWLEDSDNWENVKLKFEDGAAYKEILVGAYAADIIWERFKDGQSIDDCISMYGKEVPNSMKSRKAPKE